MTPPDEQNDTQPTPKRGRLTVAQQLAQLEAKRQRLLGQQRKAENDLRTRQMVLIGVAVSKAIEDDAELRQRVVEVLAANTTRKTDREALAPWLPPTSTPE